MRRRCRHSSWSTSFTTRPPLIALAAPPPWKPKFFAPIDALLAVAGLTVDPVIIPRRLAAYLTVREPPTGPDRAEYEELVDAIAEMVRENRTRHGLVALIGVNSSSALNRVVDEYPELRADSARQMLADLDRANDPLVAARDGGKRRSAR